MDAPGDELARALHVDADATSGRLEERHDREDRDRERAEEVFDHVEHLVRVVGSGEDDVVRRDHEQRERGQGEEIELRPEHPVRFRGRDDRHGEQEEERADKERRFVFDQQVDPELEVERAAVDEIVGDGEPERDDADGEVQQADEIQDREPFQPERPGENARQRGQEQDRQDVQREQQRGHGEPAHEVRGGQERQEHREDAQQHHERALELAPDDRRRPQGGQHGVVQFAVGPLLRETLFRPDGADEDGEEAAAADDEQEEDHAGGGVLVVQAEGGREEEREDEFAEEEGSHQEQHPAILEILPHLLDEDRIQGFAEILERCFREHVPPPYFTLPWVIFMKSSSSPI